MTAGGPDIPQREAIRLCPAKPLDTTYDAFLQKQNAKHPLNLNLLKTLEFTASVWEIQGKGHPFDATPKNSANPEQGKPRPNEPVASIKP